MNQIFQGLNRTFALAFENDAQRTNIKRYYFLNVRIKDNNVVLDGNFFFAQPGKNNKTIYENIRKIATSQGDDYTTGCLSDYSHFSDVYKMIAIDLSK